MKNIFRLEALLVSRQFKMLNYPEAPIDVFNPAAYLNEQKKLVILPRLVFDIRFYVSSIGLCEPIDLDSMSDLEEIRTRLIKYPTTNNEREGVEDPRITEDGKKVLTVGVGKTPDGKGFTSQTTMSLFDGEHMYMPKPFLFQDTELQTGRDAVLLNNHVLFFRPEAEPLRTYRTFYTETKDNIIISTKDIKVVEELNNQRLERKRGFSTNTVKLTEDTYIVGWHNVYADKAEYKERFMLLDDNGEVKGISEPILETTGTLRYGARPYTLFGCGLVLHRDRLYWIGGVGDSWIGIFSADLDAVLGEIV